MNTISIHLAIATLATGLPSYTHASGIAGAVAQTAGSLTLAIVILAVALLVAMARAARGLAILMSQFLKVAAAMSSVLLTTLISIVVAVALLVHH